MLRRRIKPALARLTAIIGCALALAACSNSPPPSSERAASNYGLPGWSSDRLDGWLAAWKRSCNTRPWRRTTAVDREAWKAACTASRNLNEPPAAWVQRTFSIREISGEALVTGYFEPVVEGSLTRRPGYEVPLYRKPPFQALSTLSRADIDAGGLNGRGLELLWLADPVDTFFLHIQGSGQVRLRDGTSRRVGYAGNNYHPYHAIGRDLVQQGALPRERVSMQSIAAWLRAHPGQAPAVMQRNPRFIYFRLLEAAGPVGSEGTVLTRERSLAVDPRSIPYGLPVWLDVEHPDPQHSKAAHLQKLTVAQDTGAAIKGPGRADFFWGSGDRAMRLAGRMRSRGRLYVLIPRSNPR